MTKIFIHPTGPFVRYEDGLLKIDDLNPEVKTKWCMSRWEMVKFAARSLWAAVR